MVEFKGTKSSWGLVAKLFHWSLALLLFWQVATGISLHNMEFSPLKMGFIITHKFFGTLVFSLVVFLDFLERFLVADFFVLTFFFALIFFLEDLTNLFFFLLVFGLAFFFLFVAIHN